MVRSQVGGRVLPDGVLHLFEDAFLDSFAFENRLAHAVERMSLVFHWFVVFEDVLSPLEVSFLHLALRASHRFGEHAGFEDDALLEATAGEDGVDDLAREHLHQVVFQAEEESRRTIVALTACATSKLVVDPA